MNRYDLNNNQAIDWLYSLSFASLITFGLLLFSIGLQYFINISVIVPSWPLNGLVIVLITGVAAALAFYRQRFSFIAWLCNGTTLLPAIVLFIAILIITVFFSGHDVSGNNIVFPDQCQLPFVVSVLWLLLVLSLSVIRMLFEFNTNNIAILFIFFGLWIVLSAAILNTGDYQRLTVNVYEDEMAETAMDKYNNVIQVPFRMRLNRFYLSEYNPELAIVDESQGKIYRREDFRADSGSTGYILDWEIQVVRYISGAWKLGSIFYPLNESGSAPAAELIVRNTSTQLTTDGWVSCGSNVLPQLRMQLDNSHQVAMAVPDPREVKSYLTILDAVKPLNIITSVNKPVAFDGWKIYQVGYDIRKRRWSDLSIIALVKAPWMPLIYAGLIFILAGLLFFLVNIFLVFRKYDVE